jgi:hypothetical protein
MPTGAKKRRKPKPRIKRTDPKQSAKFIESAKELGVDETSSEIFERAMDRLTKSPKSS